MLKRGLDLGNLTGIIISELEKQVASSHFVMGGGNLINIINIVSKTCNGFIEVNS